MRGALIVVGAALLKEFHWIMYLFGAFLVFTGIKMFLPHREDESIENNPVVRLARRFLAVTPDFRGDRFLVKDQGKWMATPLLLVLLLIEGADVVFAVDSIPAIFAVTEDPFIVYTSNVFAILGLRSLYFVLAGAVEKFYYLKPALAVVLTFVGAKMLLIDLVKIPILLSLAVILGVLLLAILASLQRAKVLRSA